MVPKNSRVFARVNVAEKAGDNLSVLISSSPRPHDHVTP